jgi:thiamine biosynthesis lipoprotein ApbE
MEHLANNSNGKINIGISPLVQLWMHTLSKIDDAILFSDICEEMIFYMGFCLFDGV